MLANRIIDHISGDGGAIEVDRGRCLRLRYQHSSCNRCAANCPAGAITIDETVLIDREKCTGCLICVADCPSGALHGTAPGFMPVLAGLKKVPMPVLGCQGKNEIEAHEKIGCLGWLSEEHLIALAAVLRRELQLNLTRCAQCPNGFIVPMIKNRLTRISVGATSLSNAIRLVESPQELAFREPAGDRRHFFRSVKEMAVSRTVDLLEAARKDQENGYGEKQISEKRALLNLALQHLAEAGESDSRREVLKNYCYEAITDKKCRTCLACAAMCPSGALKAERHGGQASLLFNSSLCQGCRLCEEFCRVKALHIQNGKPAEKPAGYQAVKTA